MKKFSNITGQTIGEPKPIDNSKLDEAKLFKVKVMNLMEQYLSIRTYGPVDRYLHAGDIVISGQELLAEAILDMFDDKTIKEQTTILESLKEKVGDWKTIDDKIDEINSNKNDFKIQYKVNNLLNKYEDNELLIQVLEQKVQKINNIKTLESYLKTFEKSNVSLETKNKINKIYSSRILEIK